MEGWEREGWRRKEWGGEGGRPEVGEGESLEEHFLFEVIFAQDSLV